MMLFNTNRTRSKGFFSFHRLGLEVLGVASLVAMLTFLGCERNDAEIGVEPVKECTEGNIPCVTENGLMGVCAPVKPGLSDNEGRYTCTVNPTEESADDT